MKSVLVLFGSVSDDYIYSEIVESLKKNFKVDFEIISAHRNPARLHERLNEDNFDFLVTGAGLAAHLPGVCASLTKKPVFGVPVEACFGGLDALLSIMQMPKDIPVGSITSTYTGELGSIVEALWKSKNGGVHLVVNSDIEDYEFCNYEVSRFQVMANELGIDITMSDSINKEGVNIVLFHKEDAYDVVPNALYIPLLDKVDSHSPASALKVFDWQAKGGVWFGVNNSRNALIFLSKFLGE